MRLPFGVKVSGDAAQRKTDEIYNPLPNVIGIALMTLSSGVIKKMDLITMPH